jgi:hypothetical protein
LASERLSSTLFMPIFTLFTFMCCTPLYLVYCLSNIFTIIDAYAILGACGNQPID